MSKESGVEWALFRILLVILFAFFSAPYLARFFNSWSSPMEETWRISGIFLIIAVWIVSEFRREETRWRESRSKNRG